MTGHFLNVTNMTLLHCPLSELNCKVVRAYYYYYFESDFTLSLSSSVCKVYKILNVARFHF